MRFIGNKSNLLDNIKMVIEENCTDNNEVFCDIFSGTGSVSRFFKPNYKIISNDILYFSYILTAATIENNKIPTFEKLNNLGIADPFVYLEENTLPQDEIGFIEKEYSPSGSCNRQYLTSENARKIDFIRTTIETWRRNGLLDAYEYKYLIASLVEAVPYVSNITGTYGAFLKHWDKRAFKNLELVKLGVTDNNKRNICYNEDANELIRKISGDILYIDPPYNERQYLPNYHVLETIAKYDSPQLSGVTGVRPYEGEKSDYCVKRKVKNSFEDLISNADFKHIIVSYSKDGLLTEEEIIRILKNHCIEESVKVYKIPYARYQARIKQNQSEHFEYIFYACKRRGEYVIKPLFVQESFPGFDQKRFVKSPLNYIGGKYKALPQLVKYFPKDVNTFVDLFAGGFNVTANMNSQRTICNDINNRIVEMIRFFSYADETTVIRRIEEKIKEFNLTKENEEGFKSFRDYYNSTQNPIDLFTLSCFSFNYQFRFNSKMEFNTPFGRNRSQFSETTKKNLMLFMEAMKSKNLEFYTRDFREISLAGLDNNDFLYCDPPYLITTGSYNDGNRGFREWDESDETDLYHYLDEANERKIHFALSNVIEHKGKINAILSEWSKKYNVHYINSNYSNCNYHKKDKESTTVEILITNY